MEDEPAISPDIPPNMRKVRVRILGDLRVPMVDSLLRHMEEDLGDMNLQNEVLCEAVRLSVVERLELESVPFAVSKFDGAFSEGSQHQPCEFTATMNFDAMCKEIAHFRAENYMLRELLASVQPTLQQAIASCSYLPATSATDRLDEGRCTEGEKGGNRPIHKSLHCLKEKIASALEAKWHLKSDLEREQNSCHSREAQSSSGSDHGAMQRFEEEEDPTALGYRPLLESANSDDEEKVEARCVGESEEAKDE